MKKSLRHIINISWTQHLLLCLVSLNILVASAGFISYLSDHTNTPQTELLVLDSDHDEHFDLKQVHQLLPPTIYVFKPFVKDYQLVVQDAQYTRLWSQMKKEILNFDIPVFFLHSTLYSSENLPSSTFIS